MLSKYYLELPTHNTTLAYELLKARTNLIRQAKTFSDSYFKESEPKLLHYRDFLLSLATTLSSRTLIYNDAGELSPTVSKNLSTTQTVETWPSYLEKDKQQYGSFLGSVAYYLLFCQNGLSLYEALQKSCRLVWSLAGENPEASISDRLNSLLLKLSIDRDLESEIYSLASEMFLSEEGSEEYDILLYCRRNFIEAQDFQNLTLKLFTGQHSANLLPAAYSLLNENQASRLSRAVRRNHTLARPVGVSLYFMASAIEFLLKAAKAIRDIEDLKLLSIPLSDLLYDTESVFSLLEEEEVSVLRGLMVEIAEALYASSLSLDLLTLTHNYKDLASELYNASLPWLRVSGVITISPEILLSRLNPLSDALFGISLKSSLRVESNLEAGLQGRPSKDGTTLSPVDNYGNLLQFKYPADYTLASIESSVTPNEKGYLSGNDASYVALVAHPGDSNKLSLKQYENLENASNVVVVKLGLPDFDLSKTINILIDEQESAYVTLNELSLLPSPRGLRGQQEASMGMVNYAFRDVDSDKKLSNSRVSGAKEEHTSRVAGYLKQLKTSHLDNSVPVIEEWVDAVDRLMT